jgi:hypothetical protein
MKISPFLWIDYFQEQKTSWHTLTESKKPYFGTSQMQKEVVVRVSASVEIQCARKSSG